MCRFSSIFCVLASVWVLTCNGIYVESPVLYVHDSEDTGSDYDEEDTVSFRSCEYLDSQNVELLDDGNILIKAYNKVMPPTLSYIVMESGKICFELSEELKDKIFERCLIISTDSEDFETLPNGSVRLLGPRPKVLESKLYKFHNGSLLTCYSDEDYKYNPSVSDEKSENITTISPVPEHITGASSVQRIIKTKNSVSVMAPTARLIAFCIIYFYWLEYNPNSIDDK